MTGESDSRCPIVKNSLLEVDHAWPHITRDHQKRVVSIRSSRSSRINETRMRCRGGRNGRMRTARQSPHTFACRPPLRTGSSAKEVAAPSSLQHHTESLAAVLCLGECQGVESRIAAVAAIPSEWTPQRIQALRHALNENTAMF